MNKYINIYSILNNNIYEESKCIKVFFAHEKSGRYEKLDEHTKLVQKYFDFNIVHKDKKRIMNLIISDYFENQLSEEGKVLLDEMWCGVPTFHDIGKINPLFQKNKMKVENISYTDEFSNLSSNHSMISAVIYIDYFARKLATLSLDKKERKMLRHLMYMNSYVIERHHSNLGMFHGNDDKSYLNKFYYGGRAYETVRILKKYCKDLCGYEFRLDVDEQKVTGDSFINAEMNFINKIHKGTSIVLYTYERLLYSLLLAADYYATTEFNNKFEVTDFGKLDKIDDFIKEFANNEINKKIRKYEKCNYVEDIKLRSKTSDVKKNINCYRDEMFIDCERTLEKNMDRDIFFLEAPTGAGKSNIAFNLSLRMAQKKSLNKIFYVYPFNTLVEQNESIIHKMFSNKLNEKVAVINSITPIKLATKEDKGKLNEKTAISDDLQKNDTTENNDNLYEKALLNKQFLNYPIVLTTSVSLFNMLFGEKQDMLMGFHKLMNSVVVIDEIQSYKNMIWTEIITFLREFARILNIKIIIMSATLPKLTYLLNDGYEAVTLNKNRDYYFKNRIFANRVKIDWSLIKENVSLESLEKHIVNEGKLKNGIGKKIVFEFIKKKSADKFYEMLCKELEDNREYEVKIMTGDDNSIARKKIIEWTKNEDVQRKTIILVATQVVEAGVDIDMDIGYKDISTLDSEEQFLGRINRSCYKNCGKVYFFNLDDVEKLYKDDIRTNREFSLLCDDMHEVLDSKDFNKYYVLIFNEILKHNNYCNKENIDEFFNNVVGKLDFKTISERMKLIDDNRRMVSIFVNHYIDEENISGEIVWNKYKEILEDIKLEYAKKQYLLSEIKSKMNYFIYEISKYDFNNKGLLFDNQIGELYYIQNGEDYFVNGRFSKELFLQKNDLIL